MPTSEATLESRALRSAADVQPRLASRCDRLASKLPRRYGGWLGLPVCGRLIRERRRSSKCSCLYLHPGHRHWTPCYQCDILSCLLLAHVKEHKRAPRGQIEIWVSAERSGNSSRRRQCSEERTSNSWQTAQDISCLPGWWLRRLGAGFWWY